MARDFVCIAELFEEVQRVRHLNLREESCLCIRFHHRRHPARLGAAEVTAYLSHLAVEKNVAASTQNVAFSALLFLYNQVLQVELQAETDTVRANGKGQKDRRTPLLQSVVVPSRK